MRMDTLKCLTEDELSLILYVVNCIDPMSGPKMEIGVKELPWLQQDILIKKIMKQEPKLNEKGKSLLQPLIAKLTRYAHHEAEEFQQQENERAKAGESNQSVFQF